MQAVFKLANPETTEFQVMFQATLGELNMLREEGDNAVKEQVRETIKFVDEHARSQFFPGQVLVEENQEQETGSDE